MFYIFAENAEGIAPEYNCIAHTDSELESESIAKKARAWSPFVKVVETQEPCEPSTAWIIGTQTLCLYDHD